MSHFNTMAIMGVVSIRAQKTEDLSGDGSCFVRHLVITDDEGNEMNISLHADYDDDLLIIDNAGLEVV